MKFVCVKKWYFSKTGKTYHNGAAVELSAEELKEFKRIKALDKFTPIDDAAHAYMGEKPPAEISNPSGSDPAASTDPAAPKRPDLMKEATTLGIEGISGMKNAELIAAIEAKKKGQ